MAKYQCSLCGHIYDEAKEGVKFDDLPDDWKCPLCFAPKHLFKKLAETNEQLDAELGESGEDKVKQAEELDNDSSKRETHDNPSKEETRDGQAADAENLDLNSYLDTYRRQSDEIEQAMADIHTMATTEQSIITAMSTDLPVTSWDDILILGAQLAKMPLLSREEVSLKTVIGKKAKQPLTIEMPVIISHMSYGALSKEAKIALATGASMAKTAIGSGEGGMLPEEFENSYRYIFEYVPNKYSVTDENLQKVDAIEIKIGQGTKPGMGGHLPGAKVTAEIAKVRGKAEGKDIVSPARFEEINNRKDLRALVADLRKRSAGRPIGIKIAAGHIEEDLEFACFSEPDFITIDGRGGATGASPKVVKNSTTLPTIYALYRARKYLDEHHHGDIALIITGGLRTSGDFAKALAMGADVVAIATAAMMATACQQYRLCQNGACPVGMCTQDPELRKRFRTLESGKRLGNYLQVVADELKTFARITGNHDIHELTTYDLITTNREISDYTNIPHA